MSSGGIEGLPSTSEIASVWLSNSFGPLAFPREANGSSEIALGESAPVVVAATDVEEYWGRGRNLGVAIS